MYRELPKSKLRQAKEEWWFQEVAAHISKQAEKGAPCDFDYTLVETMPKEVQAVLQRDAALFLCHTDRCPVAWQ